MKKQLPCFTSGGKNILDTHKCDTCINGICYIVMAAAAYAAAVSAAQGSFGSPVCLSIFLRNWGIICILVYISCRDISDRVIPNRCIIAGLVLWAVCLPELQKWRQSAELSGISQSISVIPETMSWMTGLLTGIAVFLVCFFVSHLIKILTGHRSLGGGDLKLFFLGGVLLGPLRSLYMIFLACLLELLTWVTDIILQVRTDWLVSGKIVKSARKIRKKWNQEIPFGPAISAAIIILLVN